MFLFPTAIFFISVTVCLPKVQTFRATVSLTRHIRISKVLLKFDGEIKKSSFEIILKSIFDGIFWPLYVLF